MKRIAEERILGEGLAALSLGEELLDPLCRYLDELERWNRSFNLTAVRDREQMVTRHLLDCLALLPALERAGITASPLLDVGSGAGLPGLLLALARPAWSVDLLDSNGKKARFLRHIKRLFHLENVGVIESRVESHQTEVPYAAVTSRAFASPEKFFTATRHLLAPDGRWLAMRGRVEDNEADSLVPGVIIEDVTRLRVPGLHEARHLMIARLDK